MSGATASVTHRPTRVGGALAVAAAAAAVAVVATHPGQRIALVVALVGVAGLTVGPALARDHSPAAGWGIATVGGAIVLASLTVGLAATGSYTARAELVPGLLGLALVGLGVAGLHERLSRRLASAGFVLLLCGVVLSGLFQGSNVLALLASVALAVVAWDAAEHAIGLGEQLGREARTWPAELVHVASTALVAASAAAGALALTTLVGPTEVPLGALLVLLATAVVLLVSLYR